MKKKLFETLAFIAVELGALVMAGQAFGFYAVDVLTKSVPIVGRIAYGLVAVGGIYLLIRKL